MAPGLLMFLFYMKQAREPTLRHSRNKARRFHHPQEFLLCLEVFEGERQLLQNQAEPPIGWLIFPQKTIPLG